MTVIPKNNKKKIKFYGSAVVTGEWVTSGRENFNFYLVSYHIIHHRPDPDSYKSGKFQIINFREPMFSKNMSMHRRYAYDDFAISLLFAKTEIKL